VRRYDIAGLLFCQSRPNAVIDRPQRSVEY
jgi:hypothetical protein